MEKELPVREGEIYELTVERLGLGGEGVARREGFTVFVPGALPGERVRARIVKRKKSYATAVVEEQLTRSPDRVSPRCPLYEACGGCQLQHLAYPAQLDAKRQQVADDLIHIGRLPEVPVLPTLGADDPWNYRNKVQFPVGREGGEIIIGCFARGTHTIIDTENCHIQAVGNNDIVNAVRDAVKEFRVPVYDEDRHTGVLRHVVGRAGQDGSLMIVLVTAVRELRQAKGIVAFLRRRLPKLVSVQQNIQTYRNNVILGRETVLLWGKDTIRDRIGPLSFRISPRSFFQVNTRQAEVLYRKALEYAGLTGKETVIDAYCGTGTISLFLAQRARKVYGIEIVKPAILDARRNARENHVKNAEFIVGDATAVMPQLYRSGIRADVIVTDPPRAGCTSLVLQTFAAMRPRRIVYVSCNPATLARDLAILDELGYRTIEVQPVDMFPMTSAVEVCTKLIRADAADG
ncbi:MAG: 23S rRNA (uracil(1939)-C(5))-methyltransferase RlmD [Schwartzia sp.]|nr:23S rRNA (uracil(1939)-C(5))-methyltransferase RlmD [Schwartzia sp. (in: firmicutes)]